VVDSAAGFFEDFTEFVVASAIFYYIFEIISSCKALFDFVIILSCRLFSGGTYHISTLLKLSTHFDHTLCHPELTCSLKRLSINGTKVISLFLKTAITTVMNAIVQQGNNAIDHPTLGSSCLNIV
jgi:hypothetical protein